MQIGDLVKLKGFNKTDPNEIPHGLVVANFGLDKYKIKWLNEKLAYRFALMPIMRGSVLEVLSSVEPNQNQ
tara:strand:- start:2899 stop:3111 length:213 start_codon:yes stop_codon:yes gene_type:complete